MHRRLTTAHRMTLYEMPSHRLTIPPCMVDVTTHCRTVFCESSWVQKNPLCCRKRQSALPLRLQLASVRIISLTIGPMRR
jgi:hypothetical protein